MDRKTALTTWFFALLVPVGLGAIGWAIYTFPVEQISAELLIFSIVTVFVSSYLSIQLPRTKIFVTISDTLIMFSLFVYGGQIAVLLAFLETGFTSIKLMRRGQVTRTRTIGINLLIATLSVFATHMVVSALFGSAPSVIDAGEMRPLLGLLAVAALAQFTVTSLLVAMVVAERTARPIRRVWVDDCLNVLVMFICAAIAAVLLAEAVQSIDIVLFLAVISFFGLIYLTYRRSADDVQRSNEQKEQAQRERAEEAERHVAELEKYVTRLKSSGRELKQSREKFRYAANHDALTGLPNRNYFISKLRKVLQKTRRDPSRSFAVLFLDLNRFRNINDSLGHAVGDLVLRAVAERLVELKREGDFVGHFGADEFAYIIDDPLGPDAIIEFAEEINRRVAESYRLRGKQIFTSVSIGIAIGRADYGYAEDVIRDADLAMYHAKDNNRKYAIFDKEMQMRAENLQRIETDLRYAIVCNELELFYQPIVDLSDGSLSGFEALVRWIHPTRGMISPADFIPVAESTGMIVPITVHLLHDACRQIKAWQEMSGRPLTMAVNLSGKHFGHEGLLDQLTEVLAETGIEPRSLKLEITETALMDEAGTAISMLQRIKRTGVRISIDDFGTGYSSLSYLSRFPIDTLKVDRSFVTAMQEGEEQREIVRTVIALARALELDVVAEGIETPEQLQMLRDLGCDLGQGYLFFRPLPRDEMSLILSGSAPWEALFETGQLSLPVAHDGVSEITH